MSDDPPTRQIPAADGVSVALARMEHALARGFEHQDANAELLRAHVEALQDDVRMLQSWRVKVDERATRNSTRAQQASSVDLNLEARQAESVARDHEQAARIAETWAVVSATQTEIAHLSAAADARSKVLNVIAEQVAFALKSKTAERVGLALGGFLVALLAFFMRRFAP